MKILFFGSDYKPTGGGIATYTEIWLRAFSQEKGIVGRAYIFGNKEPRTEKIGENITVSTTRSVNFFYVGVHVLVSMLKNLDCEVVHAFNLFPVGFWVVFWSKIFGKKSIQVFHGADACDPRTSKKVLALQKWTLTHAYHAIAVSESTRKIVTQKYNITGKNISVIYTVLPRFEKNTLSKNEARTMVREEIVKSAYKDFVISDDDFVVLSVSRLVKRKGVEYLIEAISKIPDLKVKLIVVGGGKERETLENLAKSLGLTDRVYFAGKVPSRTLYYACADVSILASYIIESEGDFEGLGLVLLEAQAQGLPVIGTTSGGIPEAFEKDKTGLLVPERSADALAEAILKLKSDPRLAQSMSARTTGFLEERFGRENTIGKYLKLIGMI